MKTSTVQLITIISEAILSAQIKEELYQLGASGLTITEVQGEGNRHLHSGEIPGDKIKLECIVSPEIADKILKHVQENYFEDFSIIIYSQTIEVLRPKKFKTS